MLTPRESFKVAFLRRCAEAGYTPDQIESLLEGAEKQADGIADWIPFYDVWAHTAKRVADEGIDIGGMLGKGVLAGTVAAPFAIGGGLGYGAAQLGRGLNDVNAEEVRKRELIDTYRRLTQQAEVQRQLKQRQDTERSRPVRSLV